MIIGGLTMWFNIVMNFKWYRIKLDKTLLWKLTFHSVPWTTIVSSHVQVATNNTKMSKTDLWSQETFMMIEKKKH